MKLTHSFLSLIKGVLLGITSLIPYVSSGSVLYSMSVYENFIEGLGSTFKNNKKLYLVSIFLIIGFLGGLIWGGHIVGYCKGKFSNQVILLLIGLFLGGIKLNYKNSDVNISTKNTIIFLLVIIICIMDYLFITKYITFTMPSNIFLKFLLGIISGFFLIIPGFPISSYLISAVSYSSISYFIFLLGVLLGLIIIAKIMFKLYKKYNTMITLIFISLLVVSIIILVLHLSPFTLNFTNIFTSILAFLWGYVLAINLEKENDK